MANEDETVTEARLRVMSAPPNVIEAWTQRFDMEDEVPLAEAVQRFLDADRVPVAHWLLLNVSPVGFLPAWCAKGLDLVKDQVPEPHEDMVQRIWQGIVDPPGPKLGPQFWTRWRETEQEYEDDASVPRRQALLAFRLCPSMFPPPEDEDEARTNAKFLLDTVSSALRGDHDNAERTLTQHGLEGYRSGTFDLDTDKGDGTDGTNAS